MGQEQYLSTDASAGQAPPRGYLSTDPNAGKPLPRGNAQTRPDTTMLGVDHERLRQAITDWAATSPHVPEALRPAAARTGAYFGDVGASIAELLSAPENIAGLGAPSVMRGLEAASVARDALRQPADVAIDLLMKRTGIDPAAIDLQATRMRLQAARSRTRQAGMRADVQKATDAARPPEMAPGYARYAPNTSGYVPPSQLAVRLWHGSPQELSDVNPGSMLTDQQSWAAGYTTHQPGGSGPETFAGRIHGVDISPDGRIVTTSTLHGAEAKLLELGRQALGRQPTTLREAAEAVHGRLGIDTIIARRPDGSISGAIPLTSARVAQTLDPAEAVRAAIGRGESVPDNLRAALSRAQLERPTPGAASAPETSAAAVAPTPPATAASTPAPTTPPGPIRLTSAERQAVEGLVAQGYPREAVIAELAKQRGAPPAAMPRPRPSGRPQLSALEQKEFARLTNRGMAPQQAMDLIEGQRALQQAHGLPTSEQTRQSVKDRNTTGRWPDE